MKVYQSILGLRGGKSVFQSVHYRFNTAYYKNVHTFLQVQASDPGVKTPGFFSESRMVTEVLPYALINIR